MTGFVLLIWITVGSDVPQLQYTYMDTRPDKTLVMFSTREDCQFIADKFKDATAVKAECVALFEPQILRPD